MQTQRKPKHDHVISINPRVGRNINRALILNMIRERQPISRATLAKATALNKSTVSSIVGTLLDEGLLEEEEQRGETVGRSPINLRLKAGKNFIGAIYFDSGTTQIAAVDFDGTIRHSEEIKTQTKDSAAFISHAVDALTDLRKRSHLAEFQGIGITVAGIVDPSHSTVVYAPNLGWENVDVGKIVREQCPEISMVAIENDAKACALAELWFGTNDIRLSNFVFLSIGRGIGTGIVVDRNVLGGASHAAGEFGHMTIVEDGEVCSCGNRGCWEAYASDRATIQRYAAAKSMSPDQASDLVLDDVINAARTHDAEATQALLKTAEHVALGIANIVKALDPEAIIIGGSIRKAWDLIYPEILETVTRRGLLGRRRGTILLPSSLRSSAPVVGAATLAIRQIFTDFRIQRH